MVFEKYLLINNINIILIIVIFLFIWYSFGQYAFKIIRPQFGLFNVNTTIHNDNVYVKKSHIHGFGVFAAKDIKAGDIIETAPIVIEKIYNISSVMLDYVFKVDYEHVAHGYGYSSFYNDSQNPHAYFKIDRDRRLIMIIASKDIAKDQEIYMSYGSSYWTTRNIMKQA